MWKGLLKITPEPVCIRRKAPVPVC